MSNYHVVRHAKGWAVKKPKKQAFYVASTQQEAFTVARRYAIKNEGSILVHGLGGKIREVYNYKPQSIHLSEKEQDIIARILQFEKTNMNQYDSSDKEEYQIYLDALNSLIRKLNDSYVERTTQK